MLVIYLVECLKFQPVLGPRASLKNNGEIWCWGGGEFGQLGTGTDVCMDNTVSTCNSATNYPPAKISLPLGKTAVSLSDANQGHFCAIWILVKDYAGGGIMQVN